MYDLFWFLVISFFIFYLPFKLWLTNEEKNDAVETREYHKQSRSISEGVGDILAQRAINAEATVAHLRKIVVEYQDQIELIYDIIYDYEDESQPEILTIIDRLKIVVNYDGELPMQ